MQVTLGLGEGRVARERKEFVCAIPAVECRTYRYNSTKLFYNC